MSDAGGEIAENCGFQGKILCEVPQGARGCDSRDTCDTPATGYTPPEGWRVLAVGEQLQEGDQIVQLHDGKRFPTERVGQYVCETQRYIRPIEPQPEPVQVREGQWRTRGGAVRNVKPTPECDNRHDRFPWRDTAYDQTWTVDGRCKFNGEDSPLDLIRYLGPIEEQLQPEPQAAAIEELRSEVSYVQRLLGESRQRVTHLEELVTSLRTINEAQEKSFNAANKANDDLQHRLNVVSAEWAEQTERFRRLQQANDKLVQLEVLQPIAAACHTAQTMVRDMLGHMRCLLALQHTTDRRSFCTLLESILEVFDEAECDEDEDDDTTCTTDTSEAGQG